MISKYLINRIRLMGWWEIPLRFVELFFDYCRYLCRRRKPNIGEQIFHRPIPVPDQPYLERVWKDNHWHEVALNELKQGIFEANGKKYKTIEGNKWIYCPDHRHHLPMHLGRLFLFSKMYKLANMQYLGTLNRHYHLVHLAKAVFLERFSKQAVLNEIEDWIKKNPYMEGVNWSDVLNVGVRIVNWCIIFSLLDLKTIPKDISVSLHRQGVFIQKHLSFGSSAGNHLIGELWGLFFLGHCFPDLPLAKKWREMSLCKLNKEVERQFTTEGFHKERSISYHRYLLEYLLLLLIAAENLNIKIDDALEKTIHKGLKNLSQVITGSGEVPFIGDHGHEITTDIHYISFWNNDLYASVLVTGALYFGDYSLLPTWTDFDDQRAPWYFSKTRRDTLKSIKNSRNVNRKSMAFPESGWFILCNGHASPEESSLIVRCGKMGYKSLCAHAHADQLSFVLSVRGKMLLVDPGTYTYHERSDGWRQYFRGTKAHNTVTVNNENQAESGGAMIWLTKANGYLHTWRIGREADEFIGYHDGYERIGLRHYRKIRFLKSAQSYEIFDWLEGNTKQKTDVAFLLHFHPDVALSLKETTVTAKRAGAGIRITMGDIGDVKQFFGDSNPCMGWYSPYLGIKQKCYSLCYGASLKVNDILKTRIEIW